jgi:predicted DNA-binding protein (UPF0251 family)
MPRPFKCRSIALEPGATYFKPRGTPMTELAEVVLALDEFEAVRLADLEGLYQEEAAARMKVSRQTFGNIIHAARAKIAEAIVCGKALKIEGGVFKMEKMRGFVCDGCRYEWSVPFGTGRSAGCPKCRSSDIRRVPCGTGASHESRSGRSSSAGRISAGEEMK